MSVPMVVTISMKTEDVDSWRRYVFKEYQKDYAYNDTMVIANNPTSLNALGIHTRFPIVRRERINYSSVANGSAAWWLQIDGDTVIVVNNHFESCHLTTDDRQQQPLRKLPFDHG